jgi:hypothetical protein
MRKATVDAVKPIGWPPLSETMAKIVDKRIPVFFLRSLFPGPWGHGGRLEQLERAMGNGFRSTFPWWNGQTTSSVNEAKDAVGEAHHLAVFLFSLARPQLLATAHTIIASLWNKRFS